MFEQSEGVEGVRYCEKEVEETECQMETETEKEWNTERERWERDLFSSGCFFYSQFRHTRFDCLGHSSKRLHLPEKKRREERESTVGELKERDREG